MKKMIKPLILFCVLMAFIPVPVYLAKITQSYADIVMLTHKTGGGGTGFHVIAKSGNPVIVTNAHVCQNEKELTVNYNKERWTRKVLFKSDKYDLCIVKPVFKSGLTRLSEPTSFLPHFAAGYGALSPVTIVFGTFVEPLWVTMCVERELFFCKKLKSELLDSYTFLAIGGHSGSPILNIFGQLTGVLNAGNGLHTFAVPVKHLEEVLANF